MHIFTKTSAGKPQPAAGSSPGHLWQSALQCAARGSSRLFTLLFVFISLAPASWAQDFMMQGWYWDYPKPGCNSYVGPSIAADMATRAADQKNAGFTMMWMPPLAKASFGDCSNGYDPQDLYDYGQITGQTGLGTGAEVEAWIAALTANNIFPIADVVYNHRDGGAWEDNPAARSYILNYPNGGGCSGFPATPYPVNGKMRYRLPLGGSSPNGAGDYYFKFSSASGNVGFNGRQYKLFFRTQNTGFINNPISESEPNGGGDCGQPNNQVFLGRDVFATQEVGGGCNTDEFYLQINAGDFVASGDFLEIYIEEVNGGGTGIDQRIYSIWSGARGADIVNELAVQTRTDYTSLPSGQGAMTYRHFKPNGTNPTCMVGDEEFPFFFFDVEQAYNGSAGGQSTRQVYDDWNKWLWNTVGIRGFRMDAVKHFPASFVGQLLNDLHSAGINPPMVVGEHFTSDADVLKGWVDGVYAAMTPGASSAIQVRAFDFELRQALKDACDNGLFDLRNIYNTGMVDGAGMNGANVVTFANNHDYRTAGEHILNRQMLAYAYILTNNRIGLPSVFHPDYYGIDIYGPANPLDEQKDAIDDLMQIHKAYITGANFVDYLNRFGTPYGSNYQQSGAFDHLLYQLQGGVGGKDVIVVINFENQPLRFNHTINTANAPLGTKFTLVAGNSNFPTPLVENNPFNGLPNSLYFDIPAYSYAVYVQGEPFPVDCAGLINGPAVPGTACDDGNPCTINDAYDNDCNCVGTLQFASSAITETACDNYTWAVNGQTYTMSGLYIEAGACSLDTLILTIGDTEPPSITCPMAQTLTLDANCSASLPDYTGLATANDNCGTPSVTQSPIVGTVVSGVGDMTVTLTVTDFSGLSDSCSFTVSKVENTPPTAVCLNATVFLDTTGGYVLQAADVLDFEASSDNCGTFDVISISPANLDCSDFGHTVSVLVTISDPSSNTADCIAEVYVDKSYALPAPWGSQNIGSPGSGNSYGYDPCLLPPVYTIGAGSANNSLPSDNLATIDQRLCGDFSIEVKIESITSNGWAGLTARESAATGSKMIGMYSNLGSVLRWESRLQANAPKAINMLQRPFPYWLRLVRQGNLFIGYYSTNGSSYSIANLQFIPMGSCLEVGIAAFTFLPGQTATAVFSNLSASTGPNPISNASSYTVEPTEAQRTASPHLWPNPTREAFTVEMPAAAAETRLRLLNQLGQPLEERLLPAGESQLEWAIGHLPAGVYFVEMLPASPVEDRGRSVLRLVKTD